MLDLIGLRLEEAEDRLKKAGLKWKASITKSPKDNYHCSTILRVAKQRISAHDNLFYLTVVQQRNWEAEIFASEDI